LFQVFTTGGGASQTAVNVRSGARSQISQLTAAIVVALALTILAPMFNLIPDAVLGAIVLFVVTGLIKVQEIQSIRAIRARDAALAITAFLAVVVWGMLEGILVAVLLSLLTLVFQSSRPQIHLLGRKPGTDEFRPREEHPDDETLDGMLILRTEGAIYFGNAGYIEDRVLDLADQATPPVRVILMDGSAVPDVEYTGMVTIGRLNRELEELGIELWFAALQPRPLAMMHKRLAQTVGTQERFFSSVQAAVDAYGAQVNAATPPVPVSS
jgi:MFS superfamily sulfate permease-like transporter